MIEKLAEKEVLDIIISVVIGYLYVSGRITRGQFVAEQMKYKGMIQREDAKKAAVDNITRPVTVIFDVMDAIPVVNTKIPGLGLSLPGVAKVIFQAPFGLASDFLHNFPVFGTRVK
jgi:hypothetical protein